MLKAGTAARRRTLEQPASVSPDAVRNGVERFLDLLDRRLQERDPSWVGHCKLLIATGETTVYASITAAGDQPRWAGVPVATRTAEVTLYAAVYGLTDADVALAVDSILDAAPILAEPDLSPR